MEDTKLEQLRLVEYRTAPRFGFSGLLLHFDRHALSHALTSIVPVKLRPVMEASDGDDPPQLSATVDDPGRASVPAAGPGKPPSTHNTVRSL